MDPSSASTIETIVGGILSLASRIGLPWWITLPLTVVAVLLFGWRVVPWLRRVGQGEPPPAPDRPGDSPSFPNPYPQQGPRDDEPSHSGP